MGAESATRLTAADMSMLLLDDDAVLRTRLGRALESRGFVVTLASSVADAVTAVKASPPAFAVLDLRLEDGSGLTVVDALRAARPDARIIMLTGYGNIATAVAAGVFRIDLELRTQNEPARAFYESLGFGRESVVQGYYQGREAALRMSRRLAKNPC